MIFFRPLSSYFKPLILILILGSAYSVSSQELNCAVQVNSMQVAITDKTVFEAMQRSVYEFMNNRRWTNDKFESTERIECSILITINKQINTDMYDATFTVSSSRPIFGSTFSSSMFKFQDENVQFKYLQFDVLDFSENAYISEFTSILGYYAYVILAMDYDSYSLLGGQDNWQKAQRVAANAQPAGASGWQTFSSRNNRYWLTQNALNDRFKGLRECNYYYHRNGFDAMNENVLKGRAEALKALKMIEKVHKNEPNSFNVRLFFTAKSDEIIKLYTKAEPSEKNELVSLLEIIDPANSNKYLALRDSGR